MMISKRYSPERLGSCFISMASMTTKSGPGVAVEHLLLLGKGPLSEEVADKVEGGAGEHDEPALTAW